jgi:hypothetical protein
MRHGVRQLPRCENVGASGQTSGERTPKRHVGEHRVIPGQAPSSQRLRSLLELGREKTSATGPALHVYPVRAYLGPAALPHQPGPADPLPKLLHVVLEQAPGPPDAVRHLDPVVPRSSVDGMDCTASLL